jgi:hypothetical protein
MLSLPHQSANIDIESRFVGNWVGDHTCGYSLDDLRRKPMAFLQAYIDDSASDAGDRRLYFAGYINSAHKWRLFTDAWDDELKSSPSIKYLKMVEASNRRGEFKDWKEKDVNEKLKGLARVIRHFHPMSFEFSASRKAFADLLAPHSPRNLSDPYFACNFGIVAMLSRHFAQAESRIPIEFIFDQQDGVDTSVDLFFEEMVKNLPKSARRLIHNKPRFQNDKDIKPLQAADMLAWHLRREHEDALLLKRELTGLIRNPEMHLLSSIPDETVAKWSALLRQIPGLEQLRTKRQWQKFRRHLIEQKALGYVPPYGSAWKNLLHRARKGLSRFVAP